MQNKRIFWILAMTLVVCLTSCHPKQEPESHKQDNAQSVLPIGVFDSGTGGLTVMERLLTIDEYNNTTGQYGADGIPDLNSELFQYVGDQANMPYGTYNAANKSDLLRELIRRDAQFLIDTVFYNDPFETVPSGHKAPCKIIVIACNTATAYGMETVQEMLKDVCPNVRVIGVIHAGVNATLDKLAGKRKASVGVLATVGTIDSGAYQEALGNMASGYGIADMNVVAQCGYGFAEAVDNEHDFVNSSLTAPRDSYKGPRLGNNDEDIKEYLMDVYNFEPEGLLIGTNGDIQLNSAANYARFNLVSLVERHRLSGSTQPLNAVILGCTHYPFLLSTLQQVIRELREYQHEGQYIYRDLIADDFVFIDPAFYTAKECYVSLYNDDLLRQKGMNSLQTFISVPSATLDPQYLDEDGKLTYDFKYGRTLDIQDLGTRFVPISDDNLGAENKQRILNMLPATASYMF